jgi:hypothetical protein
MLIPFTVRASSAPLLLSRIQVIIIITTGLKAIPNAYKKTSTIMITKGIIMQITTTTPR